MFPGLVRFAAALMAPLSLLTHPLVTQASPAPGAACGSAEHHQFDFWIGDWDVALPDGSRTGVQGSHGTSYNIYDAARRRWHQTWVDDRGPLLVLEGTFAGGRMTLEGETTDSAGRVQRQRIAWEPTAPDRVRQLWESSSDGGAT